MPIYERSSSGITTEDAQRKRNAFKKKMDAIKQPQPLKQSTNVAIDNLSSLWAQVDAARAKIGIASGPRPPNSFTFLEYAQKYEIGETTARRHVRKLAASGKLTAHRVTMPDSKGRLIEATVYTANYHAPNPPA